MKIIKESGITLIATVITIILMLILVGVTISTGLKGRLFDTTKEATINVRGEQVWKAIEEWKIIVEMNGYDEQKAEEKLNELLEDLLEEHQITQEEKQTLVESGKIAIGNRTIILEDNR